MGTPLDEERNYIRTATDELETYLLSGVQSWQLAGHTTLPPLTPGYILLYLKRLNGWPWVGGWRNEVETWTRQIHDVCGRWKSIWQTRVKSDYVQRFSLWDDFLNGLDKPSARSDQEFRWKVRWRTMLTLLNDAMDQPVEDYAARLVDLDDLLRRKSFPGKFIWEEELLAAFPPDVYWYLYIHIS